MRATFAALALFMSSALACQPTSNYLMSYYGYVDNDPAGPAVSYNCGGRGGKAGGDGSYANPLTAAVAKGIFAECELLYSPTLKKYLRIEDQCATCDGAWIDIWTGPTTSNGGSALRTCENTLTGSFTARHVLIQSPPDNLEVTTAELFDGTCNTANIFADNAANIACTGSSKTTNPPAVASASYIAPVSSATGKRHKKHRGNRRTRHI